MKSFSTFVIICFACVMVISQVRPWMPPAGISLQTKGIGQTTGHIATLTITNDSHQEIMFQIPEFSLPSDGTYQGFLIPEPTQVKIPGHNSITIPLKGYCTDPNLPVPPAGHSLVPYDQWDTGSPLIPILKTIISHTVKLQEAGHLNTLLSNNPPREREAIIQQTLWWYSAGPDYNPCDHILKSVSDNFRDTDWFSDGNPESSHPTHLPQPIIHDFSMMPSSNPWFAVLKKNRYGAQIYKIVSQGLAQMADAIAKVGQSAGLGDFSKPGLPVGIGKVADALPTSHPQIFNTVRVVGTGRTTGHIADLTVSNPTKEPINVRIGNGGGFLIPSNGNYQPYIVPTIPVIPVESGRTVTVPITGYCVDVRRPPVGIDMPMPALQTWIESMPEVSIEPKVPEPMNPPQGTIPNLVSIPTKVALSIDDARNILKSIPSPAARRNWHCPDLITDIATFIPGTDILVPAHINADDMPGLATPVLLDAINRIIQITENPDNNGLIKTPFANNKPKEKEAVIQQTFWIYSAGLSGQPYTRKDFEDNTIKQFVGSTGKNLSDIPQQQKEQIDKGVDDFWSTFSAVGAEAKILPKPVPNTTIPVREKIEDAFGGLDKSNIKVHRDTTSSEMGAQAVAKGSDIAVKSGSNPTTSGLAEEVAHVIQQSASRQQALPGVEINTDSGEPMARPADTPCMCKELTFNLVVKGQNSDPKKNRNDRTVSSAKESLSESEKTKELTLDDWEQGDYYTINFNSFKMGCYCQNAGVIKDVSCDFYPGKYNKKSTEKGRINLDSKPKKVEFTDKSDNKKKTVFEIISENLAVGQKLEYKYTPYADQPDSFRFCFSAYCASDNCNEKENEKSCGEYCIALKFKKK